MRYPLAGGHSGERGLDGLSHLSHGAVGFVGIDLTGWPVKFNTVLIGTETVLSRVSDSACAPPYVSLDRLKACGAFDWGSNPHGGVYQLSRLLGKRALVILEACGASDLGSNPSSGGFLRCSMNAIPPLRGRKSIRSIVETGSGFKPALAFFLHAWHRPTRACE